MAIAGGGAGRFFGVHCASRVGIRRAHARDFRGLDPLETRRPHRRGIHAAVQPQDLEHGREPAGHILAPQAAECVIPRNAYGLSQAPGGRLTARARGVSLPKKDRLWRGLAAHGRGSRRPAAMQHSGDGSGPREQNGKPLIPGRLDREHDSMDYLEGGCQFAGGDYQSCKRTGFHPCGCGLRTASAGGQRALDLRTRRKAKLPSHTLPKQFLRRFAGLLDRDQLRALGAGEEFPPP